LFFEIPFYLLKIIHPSIILLINGYFKQILYTFIGSKAILTFIENNQKNIPKAKKIVRWHHPNQPRSLD